MLSKHYTKEIARGAQFDDFQYLLDEYHDEIDSSVNDQTTSLDGALEYPLSQLGCGKQDATFGVLCGSSNCPLRGKPVASGSLHPGTGGVGQSQASAASGLGGAPSSRTFEATSA